MTPVYFSPSDPINAAVGGFVSECIWGEPGQFEKYCSMGVFHGGALVAGVVFHNWQPGEGVIELSAASSDPAWLTRNVIRSMFHLAFNMVGARLVVLRVSERNEGMRRIAQRFGFQETIIPRLRGDDEAECVYTLSASDWAGHRMNR